MHPAVAPPLPPRLPFPGRLGRFRIASSALLITAVLAPLAVAAAPFTPASDAEIVERLPGRASDPATRRVESLRKQLAARPADEALRIEIARRYFEMAVAQGDPRYVGYASAAIAPLASSGSQMPGYWLIRGEIEQFSHDFPDALSSLAKAAALDPSSPEPPLWRAAIFMVQARYADALQECAKLQPMDLPGLLTGCQSYAQASIGQLAQAYANLSQAVAAEKAAAGRAEILLWQYTRLADMAIRLGRPQLAEDHFKAAFKLGITDQYLLGAYADFLLTQQRAPEVLTLLAPWERSDILLLRLALAGRASRDSRADGWTAQLRDRFEAAAQRGDRLHEQEAARFELDLQGRPDQALALAARNYSVQKEPRDAEILMRAALAAGQPKAAQPALDWLRDNHYQDPALAQLASKLVEKGAKA